MDLQTIREIVISNKELLLTNTGAWGPVLLVGAFVLSAMTGMPIFYLSVLAGMVWGIWSGFALIMGAILLSVTLIHLLVRRFFRSRVEKKLSKDRRLHVLDRALVEKGPKVVFLLRMTPLLPLGIGSYLFSLTGVRTVPYFVATILGVAPGTFFYVWIGSVLTDTLTLEAGKITRYASLLQWIGLAAFGIVLVYLSIVLKKALGKLQIEELDREP